MLEKTQQPGTLTEVKDDQDNPKVMQDIPPTFEDCRTMASKTHLETSSGKIMTSLANISISDFADSGSTGSDIEESSFYSDITQRAIALRRSTSPKVLSAPVSTKPLGQTYALPMNHSSLAEPSSSQYNSDSSQGKGARRQLLDETLIYTSTQEVVQQSMSPSMKRTRENCSQGSPKKKAKRKHESKKERQLTYRIEETDSGSPDIQNTIPPLPALHFQQSKARINNVAAITQDKSTSSTSGVQHREKENFNINIPRKKVQRVTYETQQYPTDGPEITHQKRKQQQQVQKTSQARGDVATTYPKSLQTEKSKTSRIILTYGQVVEQAYAFEDDVKVLQQSSMELYRQILKCMKCRECCKNQQTRKIMIRVAYNYQSLLSIYDKIAKSLSSRSTTPEQQNCKNSSHFQPERYMLSQDEERLHREKNNIFDRLKASYLQLSEHLLQCTTKCLSCQRTNAVLDAAELFPVLNSEVPGELRRRLQHNQIPLDKTGTRGESFPSSRLAKNIYINGNTQLSNWPTASFDITNIQRPPAQFFDVVKRHNIDSFVKYQTKWLHGAEAQSYETYAEDKQYHPDALSRLRLDHLPTFQGYKPNLLDKRDVEFYKTHFFRLLDNINRWIEEYFSPHKGVTIPVYGDTFPDFFREICKTSSYFQAKHLAADNENSDDLKVAAIRNTARLQLFKAYFFTKIYDTFWKPWLIGVDPADIKNLRSQRGIKDIAQMWDPRGIKVRAQSTRILLNEYYGTYNRHLEESRQAFIKNINLGALLSVSEKYDSFKDLKFCDVCVMELELILSECQTMQQMFCLEEELYRIELPKHGQDFDAKSMSDINNVSTYIEKLPGFGKQYMVDFALVPGLYREQADFSKLKSHGRGAIQRHTVVPAEVIVADVKG